MYDRVAEVQKRPGCRLVRMDSGDSLLVPWMLFRLRPLRAGEMVNLLEYKGVLSQKEDRFALEQAVRLLEAKDRSSEEIKRRLLAQGYSQASAQGALEKLCKAGFLNDRRFARDAISRLGKKYGPIRLKRELAMKGVAADHIEEAMERQDHESYVNSAVVIARKARKSQRGDEQAEYRRLYGALARRGFPPDIVKKALQQMLQPGDDDPMDASQSS